MRETLLVRRARVAQSLGFTREILVVAAGEILPLPENSDQSYPFISHAEHAYLSEQACPGAIVTYDASTGTWTDFVPTVTEAERVWEGREQPPGIPLSAFDDWMRQRQGQAVAALGSTQKGIPGDETLNRIARERLTHARRPKDAAELAQMRLAAEATTAGFLKIRELLRPGLSERALQIELEAEFFRNGGTQTGFSTIVGTGPNSAVLHFSPSARCTQEGEFVLIDAGAQVGRYTADVTRTFCVGKPDPFRRDLHAVVLAAQQAAIARCLPGAEWKDIHLSCAVNLVRGLCEMGLMRGDPVGLVEQEAHILFFPHGIGHMVGLGVRDASGCEPGRPRDPRPCLRTLRMDLKLREGYTVTVEPGLYFIPALLDDTARRSRFTQEINWALVDRHKEIGGVRIEDDVLVTSSSPEVLTKRIPHTL